MLPPVARVRGSCFVARCALRDVPPPTQPLGRPTGHSRVRFLTDTSTYNDQSRTVGGGATQRVTLWHSRTPTMYAHTTTVTHAASLPIC